ncbi:MAG TPA: hypothetical protein VL096_00825 [Pirellulaceae bacterium]|nr:hypothetical protein [Pirellulaceae bacterium]
MPCDHLARRDFLRVRELLAEQIPPPQIAQSLALPLQTVLGIASGEQQPSRLIVEQDDSPREEMLTSRRCPGCGAMVYVWPCLGCQIASGEPATPRRKQLGGLSLKLKRRRLAARHQRAA